jgi:hypothetical protein
MIHSFQKLFGEALATRGDTGLRGCDLFPPFASVMLPQHEAGCYWRPAIIKPSTRPGGFAHGSKFAIFRMTG